MAKNYLENVAKNIRKRRKQLNLHQADMAKFGFNLRRYQEIESGNANLTLKTLLKVSRALRTTVCELTAEQYVYPSAKTYKTLLNQASICCLVIHMPDVNDRESFILQYCNDYTKTIFDFDIEQCFGSRLIDVFPNAVNHKILSVYQKAIQEDIPIRVKDFTYKDERTPLRVSELVVMKSAENQVTLIAIDATELEFAREQVKKLSLQIRHLEKAKFE